jgi:hypothetical protein
LKRPQGVKNIDGTSNKEGTITHYVVINLKTEDQIYKEVLMVTGLGKHDIILGLPWLERHNLDINWKTGEFHWREDPPRKVFQKVSIKDEEDDQAWMNQTVNTLDNSEHILEEINLLETTQVDKEFIDNDLLISFIKEETSQEMDNIWKQLEEEEELE